MLSSHSKTTLERAGEFNMALDEKGEAISYEGYSPVHDRLIYSKEYLLAFQPICDQVLKSISDVVKNLIPLKKIGNRVKGRRVYSIANLLKFQPLYEMMPEDFTWADTIGADAVLGDLKGRNPKKDKSRQHDAMSYDASLVCYFNPSEYATAMNMGLYTGPPAATLANGSTPMIEPVNPVEEAIFAKRQMATLLDTVTTETMDVILKVFVGIPMSCAQTLQEIIGLLFDHAIAEPQSSDLYAKLCSGMAEVTPEFKNGAKTINFRRILLTKCYESLLEEPGSQSMDGHPLAHHSWRRHCMLQNVPFIGELFRRQLLTENIMHVSVAMMLDDEVKPQAEIIMAACDLLSRVGDLLDGSSPASRRTMDEYFAVLLRIHEHCELPNDVKQRIIELKTVRTSGWIKSRHDPVSATNTPLASPAKEVVIEQCSGKAGLLPLAAVATPLITTFETTTTRIEDATGACNQ
ncbi:hypothetical protein CCR75_007589 [Bremia lactucae]|uniref:MIF4G domain-containing protein n=1 Tax=Bremia lactucae TaxID=4779 RepID=A0A976IDU3_BRELC|nr:hypothetical protein CCR75_007589 [Bremia lactucae]